jgi:hypothetical protein
MNTVYYTEQDGAYYKVTVDSETGEKSTVCITKAEYDNATYDYPHWT